MVRYGRIIVACLAGLASPAAAITASAGAQAQIVDAGSVLITSSAPIRFTIPMGMPTVQGSSTGALFVGNMPSMGMGGIPMMGADLLTVRRDAGESTAVTVPGSFMVMRMGDADALTVRTNANPEYGVVGEGILMGGALMGGWASSIDVAGRVFMASSNQSISTNLQALVVTVQYN